MPDTSIKNFRQNGSDCDFKLKHFQDHQSSDTADCLCPPSTLERRCRCAHMGETWFRNTSMAQHLHPVNLVAYVRYSGGGPTETEQRQHISSYCKEHGYSVIQVFSDPGKPAYGLAEALEALRDADGLIAVDLERFVEHEQDPLRDLRPFVHHFFCYNHKHLIAINEGIDTGDAVGQKSALDIMSKIKE